ncbi:diguanylate cyclase [Celeribacter marinus]|uniref:diguanylate cyclase n=1 Tax=Celeribacter marinus TaxID=1397108 RepID=UPI003F6B9EAC
MPGHILIADSVPTSRITMKVMLSAAHYDVSMASCANDVLSNAATSNPDVIIIDHDLGDAGAAGVCTRLKATDTLRHIPIAMVGPDTTEHRIAALRAGADVYLVKPLDRVALLAQMRALKRVSDTANELKRRTQTALEMGFPTDTTSPVTPSHIVIASPYADDAVKLRSSLRGLINSDVDVARYDNAIHSIHATQNADLVIVSSHFHDLRDDLLLLSNIRANEKTRHAAVMVMYPEQKRIDAILALDIGANAIMPLNSDPDELALRIRKLVSRKREADRLRDTIDHGMRMASVDPLTGLYNRRYAKPHLERLAHETTLTNAPLAVMLVDIDDFKSVNDTFGHALGDTVLVEVARRIRDTLRPQDLVARIGGEEFLVAMPATTAQSAHVAAERIRNSVCATPACVTGDGEPISVSISLGVAMSTQMIPNELSVSGLIDIADTALYASKSGGRNQVTFGATAA